MSRSTGTWAALQRVEALGRHAADTVGGGFNGFVDRSGSTITVKKASREIELAGSWVAYSDGARWEGILSTCVFENTEGLHYIFLNGLGRLESSTTWSDDYITRYALVAVVYWDSANAEAIFVGDERHGCVMDSATHLYLHNYLGAQYKSGLGLVDFSVDGSGDSAIHAQFGSEAGYIADADILHTISAYGLPASLPIYYLSGVSAYWRKDEPGDYVCKSFPGGRLAYNDLDGGVWKQTEVANNSFVLAHLFATNEYSNPLIVIQGQSEYTNITEAREGATTEINSLALTGLPTPEFVAIGTIIFQTSSSYTNVPKARIRSTDLGDNYVDFREGRSEVAGSPGVTDHGALTGLADDDHTQYIKVDGSRGFTGRVSGIYPTQNLHLATVSYAQAMYTAALAADEVVLEDANYYTDTVVAGYLPLAGGTMTGSINMGNKLVYHTLLDNGTVNATTKNIAWTGGPIQQVTISGACTLTFTAPTGPCNVDLIIKQHPNVNSGTITWPSTVKWENAVAPTLSTTSGYVDMASFLWTGSVYYATNYKKGLR